MLKHNLFLLEWQSNMRILEKESKWEKKTDVECGIFLLLISSEINNNNNNKSTHKKMNNTVKNHL